MSSSVVVKLLISAKTFSLPLPQCTYLLKTKIFDTNFMRGEQTNCPHSKTTHNLIVTESPKILISK